MAHSINRRALAMGLGAGVASLAAPRVTRAQAYPDKPIKLIVPFPVGGGGDVLARTVTGKMSESLGQQFVVDNRAGAGGNIGSAAAAKLDADGYNVLYGTNGTLAINHTLYRSTGFDPAKDFEPVSRLTEIALVVVVHPSLPVKSVKELIEYAMANPGKLNVATAGNGTTSHLAAEMFKQASGIQWQNVHYRGGAPAMQDLIGGQVQAMIEVMPNAMPQVTGNAVSGLAVSTAARWPGVDLPTIAESGLPGFAVSAWDALLLPKGSPNSAVTALASAAAKALGDPELQKNLLGRGAKPAPMTGADLKAFLAAELTRWGDVVRASGTKVD